MKYILMCGGTYEKWQTPKHLSVVKGEPIVVRTIRLLRESGVEDIYINLLRKVLLYKQGLILYNNVKEY